MLTIDDLLLGLAEEMNDLVRPVTAELVFGHHDAPAPLRA
jgi:hypothetical protein